MEKFSILMKILSGWIFPVYNSGKTIELDDVTFHQCVNLTRFNTEKTVSFVPPDGEFELMKYRITEGINLPFRVLPSIKELGRTRMEVNVKVHNNSHYV
jgi:AP-2 complex subunit mu-1